MDPLSVALKVAASGLDAQSKRLLVVSENMANAQSTSTVSGGDPYQRKIISFAGELDRASGATPVRVNGVFRDRTAYPVEFDPGNRAADASGYVKLPNVNMLVEMADMRETNRSYEANLQVVKQARKLISMTIDMLRAGS